MVGMLKRLLKSFWGGQSSMTPEEYDLLLDSIVTSEKKAVVAPAGHGKTYTLVQLVKRVDGKVLVLTHTNAGVSAIKKALKKASVPTNKYSVKTIDSLCLSYCQRYAELSGWRITGFPKGSEWVELRECALKLFQNQHIMDVMKASYKYAFVDEYQDCNLKQHNIISLISNALSLKVLGDPMQSIFKFTEKMETQKFNWKAHVETGMGVITELKIPHRWKPVCPELGDVIYDLRGMLSRGDVVPLEDKGGYFQVKKLKYEPVNISQIVRICNQPNTVVINPQHNFRSDSLSDVLISRSLGQIQPVEAIDLKSLSDFASDYASKSDVDLSLHVYRLLKKIYTQMSNSKVVHSAFGRGALPKRGELTALDEALIEIASNKTLENLYRCFDLDEFLSTFSGSDKPKCKRKELLCEIRRAIAYNLKNRELTLPECVQKIRIQTSVMGRALYGNVVGSTLLVKGLEFDNVVILYPEKLSSKEDFYVAISRASKKVTIITEKEELSYSG